MCAAVCVNPWTQLPEVAVFGALLGLVPAIIAAIGLWRMERMPPAKAGTLGLALLSLATVAVGAIEFLVYLLGDVASRRGSPSSSTALSPQSQGLR